MNVNVEEPRNTAGSGTRQPADPRPDLAGERILVIGLGATGLSASRFLAARGARVSVQDDAPAAALAPALDEAAPFIEESRLGGAIWSDVRTFDLIVPSPGVPREAPQLTAALRAGVPVWSEIELAYRFLRIPLIAITGSNGKSTTTSLIGAMLAAGGISAFVGGNLGTPLLQCAAGAQDEEIAVAEISSFQLEHVDAFHPRTALLLNLCEDHLDRHADFGEYARAKARLFARQDEADTLVQNADDPEVASLAAGARARRLAFSLTRRVAEGAFTRNGFIVVRIGGEEETYDLRTLRMSGVHNLENAMAALLAARVWGVSREAAGRALAGFEGLPHRLQAVRDVDGVSYYNDSKATNPGAALRSIESFTRPVVLIAGGKDKACSFEPLREAAGRNVKAAVLLGEAAPRLRKALGGVTECLMAEGLADAVARAHETAEPGDVVLLAPACSSFDMFASYAERGAQFAELVRAL